jgi:hypothetical protein
MNDNRIRGSIMDDAPRVAFVGVIALELRERDVLGFRPKTVEDRSDLVQSSRVGGKPNSIPS